MSYGKSLWFSFKKFLNRLSKFFATKADLKRTHAVVLAADMEDESTLSLFFSDLHNPLFPFMFVSHVRKSHGLTCDVKESGASGGSR